jgi:hypothetical protein
MKSTRKNYNPKLTNLQPDSTSIAHQDRDDKQEFIRIPIAGQDSDDYNTSEDDELEEEEDKADLVVNLLIVYTQNMNRIVDSPPYLPIVYTQNMNRIVD